MKMLIGMMIKNFDLRVDEKIEISMKNEGVIQVRDARVEIKLR